MYENDNKEGISLEFLSRKNSFLKCKLIHNGFVCCYGFTEIGILLAKLFWHTVRKKCSSDREKLLKFEAEGQEFAKILRSVEQFIQTVKGQNNFW